MRNLGSNLAWLLQSIAAGRQAGLAALEAERRFVTNYIR